MENKNDDEKKEGGGESTLWLVATKSIKAGEEIFWNYRCNNAIHFVKAWQLKICNKGKKGYLEDKVLFRDNSTWLKEKMNQ